MCKEVVLENQQLYRQFISTHTLIFISKTKQYALKYFNFHYSMLRINTLFNGDWKNLHPPPPPIACNIHTNCSISFSPNMSDIFFYSKNNSLVFFFPQNF